MREGLPIRGHGALPGFTLSQASQCPSTVHRPLPRRQTPALSAAHSQMSERKRARPACSRSPRLALPAFQFIEPAIPRTRRALPRYSRRLPIQLHDSSTFRPTETLVADDACGGSLPMSIKGSGIIYHLLYAVSLFATRHPTVSMLTSTIRSTACSALNYTVLPAEALFFPYYSSLGCLMGARSQFLIIAQEPQASTNIVLAT